MSALSRALTLAVAAAASTASAESTSGVDGALFRSSYDLNGVFGVEGARLMPKRDLSFKILMSYAQSPIDLAVPGVGDPSRDRILDYVVTLDMAFGLSITERVALGLDVAAYRTATGDGYGVRGRYMSGGGIASKSTGLIALRPLSNIDPSASPSDDAAYLGDSIAGPLDARLGIKYALFAGENVAITAVGSMFLPFGEDEMLLGDRNLVFEPKLALAWHQDRVRATRVIGNLGARFRQRSVLEAYDTADPMATDADAQVVLDVGSELVLGLGAVYEITPRVSVALEAQAFIPLPEGASWGSCRRYSGARCSTITDADYFGTAEQGDLTGLATLGTMLRVSADVTANIMVGTGQGGARGDDFRVTTGIIWAPQPAGVSAPGRADRDGDGIPDSVDGCSEESEDKDGTQDEDGCPDLDNDGDGIADSDDRCPDEAEDKDGFEDADGCREDDNDGDAVPDAADRCPDQGEDRDGFEDDDGCPDQDNDGDGLADAADLCPNDAETANGIDDDDGCPDVRGTTGPEERADRIDLKGAQVGFERNAATLTAPGKALLAQVATIIKTRTLTIRIEVHVPRGQKKKDKQLAQRRGRAILEYLVAQGVPAQQLQAVGLGSDRPLGAANPADPINERIDFIKAQQSKSQPGGAP
ncbi:MAG: OmpA family protein [Deltaproteobacteria bacterium]|nr:OmpA family protein [Deltaproteobacteria bacterium]